MADAAALLESEKSKSWPKKTSEIKEKKENAHTDYESLVQSRHEIVRELVSVFKLRKVAARILPVSTTSLSNGVASNATNGTATIIHNQTSSISSSGSNSSISSNATSLHGATAASPAQPVISTNFATAITTPTRTTPEYKIVNVNFTSYGYYGAQPPERFNAALGYIIHMTIILAHYLNVRLPYELISKGRGSYAQSHQPETT